MDVEDYGLTHDFLHIQSRFVKKYEAYHELNESDAVRKVFHERSHWRIAIDLQLCI